MLVTTSDIPVASYNLLSDCIICLCNINQYRSKGIFQYDGLIKFEMVKSEIEVF